MTDFCEAVRADFIAAGQKCEAPVANIGGKATEKWARNFVKTSDYFGEPKFGETVVAALEANYVTGGQIRHAPYLAVLENLNEGPLDPIQLHLAVKWAADYTNAREIDETAHLSPDAQRLALVKNLEALKTQKNYTLNFYGYKG